MSLKLQIWRSLPGHGRSWRHRNTLLMESHRESPWENRGFFFRFESNSWWAWLLRPNGEKIFFGLHWPLFPQILVCFLVKEPFVVPLWFQWMILDHKMPEPWTFSLGFSNDQWVVANHHAMEVANTLWAWAALRHREGPALTAMAALAIKSQGPQQGFCRWVSQFAQNCVECRCSQCHFQCHFIVMSFGFIWPLLYWFVFDTCPKSQGMGEFISQELANSVGNSVNLDNNSHSNQWEVGGSLVAGRASEVWAFAKLHFRHEALLTAASFLALWLTGWTDQLYLQSSSTKKSYGKLFFLTFWGLCRRHSADVCASQRFIESWLYRVIDAPVALCMFSYVTDMLGRPQLNQTILQRCAMCLLMRTGPSVSHSIVCSETLQTNMEEDREKSIKLKANRPDDPRQGRLWCNVCGKFLLGIRHTWCGVLFWILGCRGTVEPCWT